MRSNAEANRMICDSDATRGRWTLVLLGWLARERSGRGLLSRGGGRGAVAGSSGWIVRGGRVFVCGQEGARSNESEMPGNELCNARS